MNGKHLKIAIGSALVCQTGILCISTSVLYYLIQKVQLWKEKFPDHHSVDVDDSMTILFFIGSAFGAIMVLVVLTLSKKYSKVISIISVIMSVLITLLAIQLALMIINGDVHFVNRYS